MSKYEFIKMGNRYIVKNSNGLIVDEKTMLKMKNEELVLEDIKSNGCQGKITKEISKNKKRIKEIEALQEVSPLVKGETALEEKEDAEDDIIKETTETI